MFGKGGESPDPPKAAFRLSQAADSWYAMMGCSEVEHIDSHVDDVYLSTALGIY